MSSTTLPSGRTYQQHYNIVNVYDTEDTFLFSLRTPTEEEANLLMADLREKRKPQKLENKD